MNIPNLLSSYTIEGPFRVIDGNSVEIVIRPKPEFFERKVILCQYDFKTRNMVCHDVNQSYRVKTEMKRAPNAKYGVLCASLGLLCTNKTSIHFPYCYGEHVKENSHLVLLEKMTYTLDKLFATRPSEATFNPFFLLGVIFQVLWGLRVARRVFEFRHNDLTLNYIGLVKVDEKNDGKKTNLILTFQDRKNFWEVETFGYVVKIIPSLRSQFGKRSLNDVHQFAANLLSKLSCDMLDTSTIQKKEASIRLLEILHDLQEDKVLNFHSHFELLKAKAPSESSNVFTFVMPPISKKTGSVSSS